MTHVVYSQSPLRHVHSPFLVQCNQ